MLESPLTLRCGLTLKNRIVKAGTTEGLAPDGQPSESLARLYQRWSDGGAGLLITGSVYVDCNHTVRPADVVADADSPLEPWRRWAAAATADHAAALVQINHSGRQTIRAINPAPLAPSAVAKIGTTRIFGTPRAATESEIEGMVAGFVRAALLAEHAGFSGAQVHAAHGYLISQFLSARTNRRTDAWGGTLSNRARLLLRIVREIGRAVSPRFALAVKLNASDFMEGGFSEEEAAEVVRMLSDERLDLIEISGGTYEQAASFGVGVEPREAYFRSFARRARESSPVPVLLTGGIRSRETIESVLAEGTDLVGMARPLVMDPDLPRRLIAGEVDRARPLRTRFLRGTYAAAAELAWYSEQIQRLGQGKDPTMSGWSWLALKRYVRGDAQLARQRAGRGAVV